MHDHDSECVVLVEQVEFDAALDTPRLSARTWQWSSRRRRRI